MSKPVTLPCRSASIITMSGFSVVACAMAASASVCTPASSTSFSRASMACRCCATCGRSSMSRTRFIAGEFMSLGGAEPQLGDPHDNERHRDERKSYAQADPLPVPVGIEPDQVARRGVEQEVALREEDVVEGEEEGLEREDRDRADEGDGQGGDERAIAGHAPHLANARDA